LRACGVRALAGLPVVDPGGGRPAAAAHRLLACCRTLSSAEAPVVVQASAAAPAPGGRRWSSARVPGPAGTSGWLRVGWLSVAQANPGVRCRPGLPPLVVPARARDCGSGCSGPRRHQRTPGQL